MERYTRSQRRLAESSNANAYNEAVKKWCLSLESIKDFTSLTNVSTLILSSPHCSKLTRLEVCFGIIFKATVEEEEGQFTVKNYSRDMLVRLLDNIENAPFLESLNLQKTAIKIDDLDDIVAVL